MPEYDRIYRMGKQIKNVEIKVPPNQSLHLTANSWAIFKTPCLALKQLVSQSFVPRGKRGEKGVKQGQVI